MCYFLCQFPGLRRVLHSAQTHLELLVGLRHDERHGGRRRSDLEAGVTSQQKPHSQKFIQI